MKTRPVRRKVSVRRSPQPRNSGFGAFGGMLARLGLASDQLRSARSRNR